MTLNPLRFFAKLFLVSFLLINCQTVKNENIDCQNQFKSTTPIQGSSSGKIILPDDKNFMTKMRITTCECWVKSIKIHKDTLLVHSSFFSNTLRVHKLHQNAEFFINNTDKKNSYVLQLQNGLPVAFTHTQYDKNRVLIYGSNGDGNYFKECGLLK